MREIKNWYVFETKGNIPSCIDKNFNKFGLPKNFVFHPRHTEATDSEFSKLLDVIIDFGESDFKLIGTYKYSSYEELTKIWR